MIEIKIKYHPNQNKIFYESKARFKIIAKGRRFGLTKGMINYAIEKCLNEKNEKILWIDTTYGNIKKYIQRYALPIIKDIPKEYFVWNQTDKVIELKTQNGGLIDFKSADKPENIEGFGYTLIIINEAGIVLKNENLWSESIRPMMLDYKADAIIGGTPKGKKYRGKEHLFYKLFKKGNGVNTELFPNRIDEVKNYESFNFSTYDNPIIEKKEIDLLAADISPALRDQEIYGKFIDTNQDRIIKREWFRVIDKIPREYNHKEIIIQSWDTAFKKHEENDYSVCLTWLIKPNGYYLLNIHKERLEFPGLKKKAIELYEKYKPQEIIIEDKASGQSLIQELKSETRLPIKAIKVDKDKIARVHSITPIIESGNVVLDVNTPGLDDFLNECEDFPNGEFDDQVDSMSQFLEYSRTLPKVVKNKIRTKRIVKKRKVYQ